MRKTLIVPYCDKIYYKSSVHKLVLFRWSDDEKRGVPQSINLIVVVIFIHLRNVIITFGSLL